MRFYPGRRRPPPGLTGRHGSGQVRSGQVRSGHQRRQSDIRWRYLAALLQGRYSDAVWVLMDPLPVSPGQWTQLSVTDHIPISTHTHTHTYLHTEIIAKIADEALATASRRSRKNARHVCVIGSRLKSCSYTRTVCCYKMNPVLL